jgi:hypothetical protein
MGLTNNQSVAKVAYLLRYADTFDGGVTVGGSLSSAWYWKNTTGTLHYGLQLLNAGKSPFGYRQGFARVTNSGPNACDFAFNSSATGVFVPSAASSIAFVYAGTVPAHGTHTITLNYRGM